MMKKHLNRVISSLALGLLLVGCGTATPSISPALTASSIEAKSISDVTAIRGLEQIGRNTTTLKNESKADELYKAILKEASVSLAGEKQFVIVKETYDSYIQYCHYYRALTPAEAAANAKKKTKLAANVQQGRMVTLIAKRFLEAMPEDDQYGCWASVISKAASYEQGLYEDGTKMRPISDHAPEPADRSPKYFAECNPKRFDISQGKVVVTSLKANK